MTGSGEAVEVYSLGRSPKEHELSGARPVSAVATRRSQPSGGERASRPTSPPERLAMSVATYLPPQRPSTASSNVGALITSELPTSASLPTLIKADLVQLGVGRPVLPKKPTAEEELSICRRRVRTLEVELKKAKGALVRDRDLAEHGMTKSEFEKQVSLWNHAKEQLQRQHASELEHVRAEYEERLASTTKDYDSKLKSSASDLKCACARGPTPGSGGRVCVHARPCAGPVGWYMGSLSSLLAVCLIVPCVRPSALPRMFADPC